MQLFTLYLLIYNTISGVQIIISYRLNIIISVTI
nr:MAG TPA: hypothetical protein [Bacteriophage sp.]